MNKSKVLSVALAAAMVASIGATAALSVNAAVSDETGITDSTVGICGSFNNWGQDGPDAVMQDDDGDRIWEGTFHVDSVTEAMIGELESDSVKTGKFGLQFKVRLNNSWDDSWGEYEADYVRTNNSQTNCMVDATVGQPITVKVKLDTTKAHPDSLAEEPEDLWSVWPVTYEVVAEEAPAAEEPKAEEPKAEEPKDETPPADTSKDADTESPATGDATSAAALVAVVLASLGTAVVMTKKASVKE